MSDRKQISYLELRENGQRIQSAGYAKLESMENEDILTVQLNGQNFSQGRTMPLYLNRESGEELLCEMTAEWGRASCVKRIPGKEDRKPILGIRILLGLDLVIVGSFAGTGNMKKIVVSKPKAVKEIEEQERSRGDHELLPKVQEQLPKAQEQMQRTPEQTGTTAEVTAEAAILQEAGEHRGSKDSGVSRNASKGQPAKKADAEHSLHMKDTKWEQLSSIYPHIHPFRDTREFLSVGPEDFVVLRERCYQMTHNSFLLHGYYNYRHLLLMRQETPDQVKYYIGVPGNFYEREKQVARMFGFESFEGTREPAWEGDFGYYLISVEL